MKKIVSTICAVLLCASSFAFEWGGIFTDNSKFSTPNFSTGTLNNMDALYLWCKTPVGSNMNFGVEGLYKLNIAVDGKTPTFVNVLDVDLLKLSGEFSAGSGKFSFGAGRFINSDVTGSVFAQLCDGVALKFALPVVKFSAYAGYTGLLNSLSVTMIDDPTKPSANTQLYTLSHAFVPVSAQVEFPVIFLNQSLSFDAQGFIDVEKSKASRYYATALLSGPISNVVFYTLSSTFGSENFKNCMNYSRFQFYWFPKKTLMFLASCEYASGNNGSFSPFKGITYVTVCNSATSPFLSSVIIPQLSVSATIDDMWIGTTAKYLFDVTKSVANKGLEFDLNFVNNIFTDLKVGCDVSAFIDTADKKDSLFAVTVNATLAF